MLDLANWISSDCKQRQFQRENRLISGFVSKPKLYNTKTVKDAAKLGGEELAHARTQILGALWEGPYQLLSPTFGHCPLGRGCLNACPDGLGHLFREELSKFKWAFAWLWGGQNACQDGLGHLCSENWSSNGHLLMSRMVLILARSGTYVPSKWWFDKFAVIGPKSARLSATVQFAIWLMPKWRFQHFLWGFLNSAILPITDLFNIPFSEFALFPLTFPFALSKARQHRLLQSAARQIVA